MLPNKTFPFPIFSPAMVFTRDEIIYAEIKIIQNKNNYKWKPNWLRYSFGALRSLCSLQSLRSFRSLCSLRFPFPFPYSFVVVARLYTHRSTLPITDSAIGLSWLLFFTIAGFINYLFYSCIIYSQVFLYSSFSLERGQGTPARTIRMKMWELIFGPPVVSLYAGFCPFNSFPFSFNSFCFFCVERLPFGPVPSGRSLQYFPKDSISLFYY